MTTALLDDPILQETDEIWSELGRILEPPPHVSPGEWCRHHGFIPEAVRSMGPAFRPIAYQRGVLEAWADPNIEEVVLMWGTQLGKTILWNQLIPFVADEDPGPALIVTASQESARKLSKTRIYPLLAGCRRTAHLLPAKHEQEDLMINLRHMVVFFGWSGSVATLGELSIRYLFMTELDKWSTDITGEADPEALAGERVKAFPLFKLFKEGTPTIEGASRIARAYELSDQRRYFVPCPHCGEHQALVMGTPEPGTPGVKWQTLPDGKSDAVVARLTACYECAHCGQSIRDEHKAGMLRRGRWLRQGERITKEGVVEGEPESPNPHRAGFHLSSLYSPTLTWGQIAAAFVEAKHGGIRNLQNFINSWLAETWQEGGERPQWEQVRERLRNPSLKPYHAPKEVLRITAGADVQADRVYYAVWGWGLHETGWLLGHGQLRDIEALEDAVLKIGIPHDGHERPLRVHCLGVDCRYRQPEVYHFCRRIGSRAVPTMGRAQWLEAYTYSRKPNEYGVVVVHINSSGYKQQIYDALAKTHLDQLGALNMHERVSEDFLRQLCGEALRVRTDKKGRDALEWIVVEKTIGNHYLDCTVIAYALAMDILQPDLRREHTRQGKRKRGEERPEPRSQWLQKPKQGRLHS